MLDDLDHFRRLAAAEREAAEREPDAARRQAHERMASQFDRILASDRSYRGIGH